MTQTKVEAPFVENNVPFRNKIINGDMQIFQRSTSATGLGASAGYFHADRFDNYLTGTAGRFTGAQIADGPGVFGLNSCLKLSCTTADTSIAAGELYLLQQHFEGQNMQDLRKGTSDAKKVTVSFYVKGNASAKYTCNLYDNDTSGQRLISQTFDVTTSWTRIVLTFPGDTTGALDNDNNWSFSVWWTLHGGSTYSGGTFTSNTWEAYDNGKVVGDSATSFFDSTDRTFFITGVQLEVGEAATDFEVVPFDVQFQRCQRYLQCITHNATTSGNVTGDNKYVMDVHFYNDTACYGSYMFPVQMRGTPTVVATDTSNAFRVYYKGTYDSIDNLALEGTARFNHILLGNYTDIADNDQAGAAAHIYNYDNAQVFVQAEL